MRSLGLGVRCCLLCASYLYRPSLTVVGKVGQKVPDMWPGNEARHRVSSQLANRTQHNASPLVSTKVAAGCS